MPEECEMITQHYFSYLIRIWQGEGSLPGGWHASLEDPITQQTIFFNSIKDLFTFLDTLAHEDEPTRFSQNELEV